MIAEAAERKKGIAREAVILLMQYGIRRLSVERFYCKIHDSNEASLRLFKSLGYRVVNYVSAFSEYELEFLVASDSQDESLPYYSLALSFRYVEYNIDE